MKKRQKQLLLWVTLSAIVFFAGCQPDEPNPEPTPEVKSPYITRVFEYSPAPGQFVNKMPKYEAGDTPETMAKKAQDAIAYNKRGTISLGGYGGYIVVGFDHIVENKSEKRDFQILGNAFWDTSGSPDSRSGSSEPGIVMVSVDANKNGLPDDEWYELAGSEYKKPETIKNYRITYFKPDENKTPVPHEKYKEVTDAEYIKWNATGNTTGYMHKNQFHTQSYWPQWIKGNEITFTGTKLTDNCVNESGTGQHFVLNAYDWGYADNAPNNNEASKMDIDWAVDKNGNSVKLAGIDFVKIYTAVNQQCGWIGETSTEIMGITDLHITQN
ncbi:PKD domain-containing protein [Petrimonas sp.]|uniref:PKD domain-containing protein n=1 Tax=Petrimonas sp. TaxID=2023866 RepID=UPI003F5192D8